MNASIIDVIKTVITDGDRTPKYNIFSEFCKMARKSNKLPGYENVIQIFLAAQFYDKYPSARLLVSQSIKDYTPRYGNLKVLKGRRHFMRPDFTLVDDSEKALKIKEIVEIKWFGGSSPYSYIESDFIRLIRIMDEYPKINCAELLIANDYNNKINNVQNDFKETFNSMRHMSKEKPDLEVEPPAKLKTENSPFLFLFELKKRNLIGR